MAIFSFQVVCPLQESAKRKMTPAIIHYSVHFKRVWVVFPPKKDKRHIWRQKMIWSQGQILVFFLNSLVSSALPHAAFKWNSPFPSPWRECKQWTRRWEKLSKDSAKLLFYWESLDFNYTWKAHCESCSPNTSHPKEHKPHWKSRKGRVTRGENSP